ncbi:anaerobic ribonucleoside-triphosphate reductase activating protein [Chitinivibrio alkaliphilus]|uniref:Anaerobic ribonucleoside-triphosphate reductase activating protein n=1 Tax=Chitinivibrio alkaliphilus ACht1 TaxID=1313304 RepID=U7D8C3_9BACT|nr:anaerobic ribonucleoside-triphosphate reductase activating protein [Chitinivibrio alkaliphilus]ERP39210.1 anaerobic ribonucleoside-triphosphate reductase activating protein [Chitinivibrio alkaliphilus ACht1]
MSGRREELYRGIVALQKNSFIDFPGTVAAVLFFDGCNLCCPYCHNALLARPDPVPVSDPPGEIDSFLRQWKHSIDGVVLTGGEPTLHRNLPELVGYLRSSLGYRVKVDTNGLRPEILSQVEADYLAMDLKTVPRKYRSLLGGPEDSGVRLAESLSILSEFPGRSEVRITLAPGVVSPDDISELAKMLTGIDLVCLQQFDSRQEIYSPSFFTGSSSYTRHEIEQWARYIQGYAQKCIIR